MQRDLRPERAAIERRSSPVAAGRARAPLRRCGSTAAEPVSEMDLKRTSAEEKC